MKLIKTIGLALFLLAMGLFITLLFMTRYQISNENIAELTAGVKDEHQTYVVNELSKLEGEAPVGKIRFVSQIKAAMKACNAAIFEEYGVEEAVIDQYLTKAQTQSGDKFLMTEASREQANALLPEGLRQTVNDYTGWLMGREYASVEAFNKNVRSGVEGAIYGFVSGKTINPSDEKSYLFDIVKTAGSGSFWTHPFLYFLIIIIGGAVGALLYIFPAFFDGMPGIKHNHIYFNSSTSQGLIGILTGGFLIGFYILLYFFHYYIAEWISLVDPVSQLLRGEDASQWFMYGFLYTVAIIVMGIRMFAKYRHSNYHKIRTASVMFFQIGFAFLIPQILYRLNLPEMDLKDLWPLNYDFLFEWNINQHIESGSIGTFMLVWGIIASLVAVPVLTYFYGKRWYCSWVCGCGGLAETLGDPYRQLSDKSLRAWKIERYLIHGVLVFAIVMTGLVLYTFFTGSSNILFLNSYNVRSFYGFAIGSVFAGVIGTGFYPLMGNRVWCRFGCPLAAYLGLVQRFKSRFRITTNGGQCISCGNCSTYCEMGIDVRWYAQRGQNIVRSSCVGCGVCAAVCPRGVLSLENGPNTDSSRMEEVRY